jgi:hypothetical protein
MRIRVGAGGDAGLQGDEAGIAAHDFSDHAGGANRR